MRILLVNHYSGGPEFGMEFRPHHLGKRWVASGHDVTVLAADFAHTRYRQPHAGALWTEEYIDGVRYYWLRTPSYSGNGFRRVLNIFSFVSAACFLARSISSTTTPDIVISASTYLLDIFPCYLIARLSGAPLIYELHDLWPLSPIQLGGMSPKHPFIRLVQYAEDFACKQCDRVASLLPHADRHLETRGLEPGKFCHLPNGVDIAAWEESPESLPEQLQSKLASLRTEGNLLVGYTGAHGTANALDSLLDAAHRLRNVPVQFLLVGNGPEKRRLQSRVATEKLDNVHFLDPVPKKMIPALLKSLDVAFIGLQNQPLFQYGISPNKLNDYMMAGVPIIMAIDAGAELIRQAQSGIQVKSEDPDALAAACRQMVNLSPAERNQLGANGREFVLRHLDYDVIAKAYCGVFNHTITKKNLTEHSC